MIDDSFHSIRLHEIKNIAVNTFWYLCSPYARYVEGRKKAFREANSTASLLISAGIPVFSPISHSHQIAKQCNMDPDNHDLWLGLDLKLLAGASGVLINPLIGWRDSRGISMEIDAAKNLKLPIFMLDLNW